MSPAKENQTPIRLPGTLPYVALVLFAAQAVTGVLLMTVYSPSTTSAWGSVWYLQTQVPAGWFVRGLHHFVADAMVIVLAAYALQLVMSRACLAFPGAWWTTLCLLGLTLALSLSGELLPWDQAGFWSSNVRLNILARVPWLGEPLRRLLIGGAELGQLSLTHFFTLHVVVLPLLAWVMLRGYRRLRARAAVAKQAGGDGKGVQAGADRDRFKQSIAAAFVFGMVVAVVWYANRRMGQTLLDAPADATASDYPARPEWHTLFLYQWLKYFQGPTAEVVGAVVIPSVLALTMFALPLLSRILRPGPAHRLFMGAVMMALLTAGGLTSLAMLADRDPETEWVQRIHTTQASGQTLSSSDEAVLRAHDFNRQREHARSIARRSWELAAEHGIPPEGPLSLLANDPMSRGPKLFAAHCASCHRFDGHDGLGRVPIEPATSSDLRGYGTQKWIRGLLQNPMATKYFGRMKKPDGEPAHTRMQKFLARLHLDHETDTDRQKLNQDLDSVAIYLEFESRHPGRLAGVGADAGSPSPPLGEPPARSEAILRGRRFFVSVCNECHSYDGERSGTTRAPEMMGYAGAGWIEAMIADPTHETRYGSTGREPAQMPPFKEKLSERDRQLLAEWLSTAGHADDR